MTNLGYLEHDNEMIGRILSTDDNKCYRYIRDLDKQSGRSTIKVGLIYVKYGQHDERDIFSNEMKDTSPLYREFVKGLGAISSLESHKGYSGLLERTGRVGKDLPYYGSTTLEVAFHEVVRMPTKKKRFTTNRQKRHVGNDIIHIIWSEHCIDYDPTTIVSHFNSAHIVIYPIQNGLFRIQIAKQPKVGEFGPLVNCTVVSKNLLPDLVRETAINAHLTVKKKQEGNGDNFKVRKTKIEDTIRWTNEDQKFTQLTGSIVNGKKNKL